MKNLLKPNSEIFNKKYFFRKIKITNRINYFSTRRFKYDNLNN